MQVTNGSVTLELQQATKNTKIKQKLESAGNRVRFIQRGTFYVVHADGTYEIFGDVFPANGWSEVGSAAPAGETVVEETPVEEATAEEETVDEEVAVEEPAEEEAPAPAPAPQKPRRRLGRRR